MQNAHLYTPEQRDKCFQLEKSIEFKKESVERLSSSLRPTKRELEKRAQKEQIRKRLIDEIKQEEAELKSLLKI